MAALGLFRAAALGLLLAAAPAPTPPPAPAPAQAGPFLIFFDYDSAEIGPQAAAVLANAIAARRARPGLRLVIDGHADRAHSYADSEAISRRRAWAVYDHLVLAGVPGAAIQVHYYGEERPLVATEDGVREPQNRRAEIRLEPANALERFRAGWNHPATRKSRQTKENWSGTHLDRGGFRSRREDHPRASRQSITASPAATTSPTALSHKGTTAPPTVTSHPVTSR